jgi:hypothetical protein
VAQVSCVRSGFSRPARTPQPYYLIKGTHSAMKFTRVKLVEMGQTKKYLFFDKSIKYDFKVDKPRRKQTSVKRLNPDECLRKTRKRLRERMTCNAWEYINPKTHKPFLPQFITFTFGTEVKDFKVAHPIFRNFVKRLNHLLKTKLHYISIPEYQPVSGRVHYHVIFFDLPFIDDIHPVLTKCWANGFIFGKKIKNLTHLIRYISKYIQKDFSDQSEKNKKRYLCSHGLKKTKITMDEQVALADLGKSVFEPGVTVEEFDYVAPDGRKIHEIKLQYPGGTKP